MKKLVGRILPWIITAAALYYAFSGVDWSTLLSHLKSASLVTLGCALALTMLSYLLRARRWQHLFPTPVITYWNSLCVLLLGFFMNNLLPARAGEFVRAHLGAKATGETRTLVLATIASERLADGVTLSLIFAIFALGIGDAGMSQSLLYVAYLFAIATFLVALVLLNRKTLFRLTESLSRKFNNDTSRYAADRIKIFFNGLSPLYSPRKFPLLCLWSIVIWNVELAAYYFIQDAFGAGLSLPVCVLFMVTVNFSSLIPAAPGAIGVIEAAGSAVLVSVGVDREHALSMVLAQHAIQYLVVGLPGAAIMLTWKKHIQPEATNADLEENGRLQEKSLYS